MKNTHNLFHSFMVAAHPSLCQKEASYLLDLLEQFHNVTNDDLNHDKAPSPKIASLLHLRGEINKSIMKLSSIGVEEDNDFAMFFYAAKEYFLSTQEPCNPRDRLLTSFLLATGQRLLKPLEKYRVIPTRVSAEV